MTNREIAEYLIHITNDIDPKSHFFICGYLDLLYKEEKLSTEEYWGFKELLWSYVDQKYLKEITKCNHLDHNYPGAWFKSKAGRIDVLNKIIDTNITKAHE
jgi:hypothetical protein